MNELDCKDIKALLSGLIDGELDGATRHQAERHLAGCQACRDLVDETEHLNSVLALDAHQAIAAALPESFQNAVLRQTVYAEAYEFAGRRWTSWLGWVAAAACLGLATSLWFVNQQMSAVQSNALVAGIQPRENSQPRPSVYAVSGQSWTYEGSLPASDQARHAPAINDETYRAIDDQLATIIPINYTGGEALAALNAPDDISREDAETLYAASLALDLLGRADLSSFADVERVREIAEYDNLVARLGDSRARLDGADRAAVMAAESILLRVVNGPMSADDLNLLHDTVASMELSRQMQAISDRWQSASSL